MPSWQLYDWCQKLSRLDSATGYQCRNTTGKFNGCLKRNCKLLLFNTVEEFLKFLVESPEYKQYKIKVAMG